jgi:AraC-like DNA-binding protein
MSPRDMTGLARIPIGLLDKAAKRYGLDREELMAQAGFGQSELDGPDSRVPLGKIWNVWRIMIDQTGDPALGLHLGVETRVRELGLVGYAAYHSQTLRAAFDRIARYSRIVNEALVAHMIDDEDRGTFAVENAPRLDLLRHPIDGRMASVTAVARELTGVDLTPLEVRLPYPRPDDTSEHRRIFRCPVQFDQSESMIVFRKVDLDRQVVHADETLTGYLDKLAEDSLKTLSADVSFKHRVRRAIWSELSGGKPNVRQISMQLGVSSRTLQRRLEEEHTSFAAELDSLRHEMASRLLQDNKLAVYEIAFLLGYSEPSTFYRAFRRWKRVSPHEFRRSIA